MPTGGNAYTQIDQICVYLPFSAEQLLHIQNAYARGDDKDLALFGWSA